MRLFLAIELPDAVRRHLQEVQSALAPALNDVSFMKIENLHVTLKFLGEVDDKRTVALCDSLAKVSAQPIELAATGIECFPPRGPIRIVAAQMTGDTKTLAHVHASIEQRCKFLGFEKESRGYRPHVTLARARRPLRPRMRDAAQEITRRLFPGPAFVVTEVVLMESRLKPSGSEYVVAARFGLVEKNC